MKWGREVKLTPHQKELPSQSPASLGLSRISKGKIDAIKYAQALKEDGKMSEDICLVFDKMYIQKRDGYFGGELIGSDKSGGLHKGIVCFMIASRIERVHSM